MERDEVENYCSSICFSARQYVPCHWYGQPSVLVSKEQCKRAPEVPWELPILKSVYLLEK